MTERPNDPSDDIIDRWMQRLDTSQLQLTLPAEHGVARRMTWLHVGSSNGDKNARKLRDVLGGTDPEFTDWLAEASSAPAFWSQSSYVGVRLPLELGVRSLVLGDGIPEDLTERIPLIKIAVVGSYVVTSLGLSEDISYELPASLIPNWYPDLDEWAERGASAFAHELLLQLITDIAWYHTSNQTLTREEWHRRWTKERLESTIITEAHLGQLRVQHATISRGDDWFVDGDHTLATRIDRALELCFGQLQHSRELDRDLLQLSLLSATHELAEAERAHREARARETRVTERLTARITWLSALFLPATLVVGVLGSNWSQYPLPSGWLGLGLVIGAAILASALIGGVVLLQLRRGDGPPSKHL